MEHLAQQKTPVDWTTLMHYLFLGCADVVLLPLPEYKRFFKIAITYAKNPCIKDRKKRFHLFITYNFLTTFQRIKAKNRKQNSSSQGLWATLSKKCIHSSDMLNRCFQLHLPTITQHLFWTGERAWAFDEPIVQPLPN